MKTVITLVVEHILLHYAGGVRIPGGIEGAAVVFVKDPIYPYVYRESGCPCQREEHDAVGDLLANSEHRSKYLVEPVIVRGTEQFRSELA